MVRTQTLWARFTHPENGSTYDQEKCKKYLEPGKPYRVVRLYARNPFWTEVKLEGIDCSFNTVMFDFEEHYKSNPLTTKEAFNNPEYEKYWYKDIV